MRNASRICGTSIPWWVLGDERYQGHGAVPALRSTNIPGYDPTVSGVGFDPSLGRASYVVRRSGESVSVRRFTPDTLAAAPGAVARRPSGHAPPSWAGGGCGRSGAQCDRP